MATTQMPSGAAPESSAGDADGLNLGLATQGLPESIVRTYANRGISELYRWQAECLAMPGVSEGRNLVYCAPTSGGKTLVSEILMLRRVVTLKKPAIFVLPYVSIVSEKVRYIQDLVQRTRISVKGFYGGSADGIRESFDIAVCTIEKANALVNRLIEEGSMEDALGTLVVDELHLAGDGSRGYLLEVMLSKVLFLAKETQIVGLSATLPNVEEVAQWLQAVLYRTAFRPVPLQEYILVNGGLLNSDGSVARGLRTEGISDATQAADPSGIVAATWEVTREGHSALVFCSSKLKCEKVASLLAEFLPMSTGEELQKDTRAALVSECHQQPTGTDATLVKTLLRGVAFHHSGLTTGERAIIERGYRSGAVMVICATSTLAAGVNLPARRVIFHSPYMGNSFLDSTQYKQMAGRAGRTGQGSLGESVLIASANQLPQVIELIGKCLPPVTSCLRNEVRGLKRLLLEVLSVTPLGTGDDLIRFCKCTLLVTQKITGGQSITGNPIVDHPEIASAVEWLLEHDMFRLDERVQSYIATPLGRAVCASTLEPQQGYFLWQELQRARPCISLDTDLHICYLVTPPDSGLPVDFKIFSQVLRHLSAPERRVVERVGVRLDLVERASFQGKLPSTVLTSLDGIHLTRFFSSLVLWAVLHETPPAQLLKRFALARGNLQQLQRAAAAFTNTVAVFCNKLQWYSMEALILSFQHRLTFGVRQELVPLMAIPNMDCVVARALFEQGFTTAVSIAGARPAELLKVLRRTLPHDVPAAALPEANAQHLIDVAKTAARNSVKEKQKVAHEARKRLREEANQPAKGGATSAKQLKVSVKQAQQRVQMQEPPSLMQEGCEEQSHNSIRLLAAAGQAAYTGQSQGPDIVPATSPILHQRCGLASSMSVEHAEQPPRQVGDFHVVSTPIGIAQRNTSFANASGPLSSATQCGKDFNNPASAVQAIASAPSEAGPSHKDIEKHDICGLPSQGFAGSNTTIACSGTQILATLQPGRSACPPLPAEALPTSETSVDASRYVSTQGTRIVPHDEMLATCATPCRTQDGTFSTPPHTATINRSTPLSPAQLSEGLRRIGRRSLTPHDVDAVSPAGKIMSGRIEDTAATSDATAGEAVRSVGPIRYGSSGSASSKPAVGECPCSPPLLKRCFPATAIRKFCNSSFSASSVPLPSLDVVSCDNASTLSQLDAELLKYEFIGASLIKASDGQEAVCMILNSELAVCVQLCTNVTQRGAAARDKMLSPLLVLQHWFGDPQRLCISSDVKELVAALLRRGCDPRCCFCEPRIAYWLMDPDDKTQDTVADLAKHFGVSIGPPKTTSASLLRGIGLPAMDPVLRARCSATWAEQFLVMPLMLELLRRLESQSLTESFWQIEMPIAVVLAWMEHIGIAVDTRDPQNTYSHILYKLAAIEEHVKENVGRRVLLSSGEDVGRALFEDLGVPPPRGVRFRRKNNGRVAYRSSVELLKRLPPHPMVEQVLEHRRLLHVARRINALSQAGEPRRAEPYCETCMARIGHRPGSAANANSSLQREFLPRVSTELVQTATATGRLATAPGSMPFLQMENPFTMNEVWRPSIHEELLAGRMPEIGARVFATVATEAPPQQRRLREGVLQAVLSASCAEPFPESGGQSLAAYWVAHGWDMYADEAKARVVQQVHVSHGSATQLSCRCRLSTCCTCACCS
jgi:replicative superfamily II helicase